MRSGLQLKVEKKKRNKSESILMELFAFKYEKRDFPTSLNIIKDFEK